MNRFSSSESKDSSIEGAILPLVLILTVIILTGSYILFSTLEKETPNTSKKLLPRENRQSAPTPSDYPKEESVTIPELFPEVSWQGPEIVSKEDNQIFIYISKRAKGGGWEFYSEPISLSGKRWTATLDKDNYSELFESFENYYIRELKNNGRGETLSIGNFEISAIIADGPTGSTWGYLISKDGSVQEIVLSNTVIPESNTYQLIVEVSDPYSLEQEMDLDK